MAGSYRVLQMARQDGPGGGTPGLDKALIDTPDNKQVGQVKGAGPYDFYLDDKKCTMVVVLPRVKAAGGTVDPRASVENPAEKAKKIFFAVDNPDSDAVLNEFADRLAVESMPMDRYQVLIRDMFKQVLAMSGVEVTTFASLDKDEDFAKLYLDYEGDVIKDMATKIKYEMPLKASVYKKVKPRGPYQGETPMVLEGSEGFQRQRRKHEKRMEKGQEMSTTSREVSRDSEKVDNDAVYAKETFTIEEADQFQPFKKVDCCRILEFWLDQWVSLDELENQGIISMYFPCPKIDTIEQIYEKVAIPSWTRCFLPSHEHDDLLRAYFGEQITFFFRFMAYLSRSLVFLAVVGGIYYILHRFFSSNILPSERDGIARSGIGVYMSLWAAFLFQVFNIRSARTKVSWGVTDFEGHEQIRPEWDYTKKPGNMGVLVNACAVAYAAVYICAIFAILNWQKTLREEVAKGEAANGSLLLSVASFALIAVIKGGSFLWGKLVPPLVALENYRTEENYNNKVSILLASIKIFVAIWPFVTQCFLTSHLDVKCADTFEKAAEEVWHGRYNASQIDPESVDLLKNLYSYQNRFGQQCIYGCFPELKHKIESWSETNCDKLAKENLRLYFIIQLVTEVGFVILAICLTKFAIWQERRKKEQQQDSDDESPRAEQQPFSFLEFSAKLHKYELDSWGGSIIDDFLEVAISYSIIVCFGLIAPIMSIIALVGFSLSYHIRVYRMLFVTRRPLPRASAGLGVWESVFQMINTCAVVINTALVACFFYPGRSMSWGYQLLIFLAMEHGILILRSVVDFLVPDQPGDVKDVLRYNSYIKIAGLASNCMRPHWKPTSLGNVNFDPNPDGIESDESGSETAS
eukprot:TRINITY_DN76738_c0_g1_i1.p1 TRINITY_DN76738_c0_g1~~TRINITY_DN76738_c0_g1_i1.p1  ORF type:complete len:861 (+),score=152.01 TRINITY_DN76738_c0_g1_i1:47-2629(+)